MKTASKPFSSPWVPVGRCERPAGDGADLFDNYDPLGFEAGDANLYRYVGNSPTNATDPSGLEGYYASTAEKLAAVTEFGTDRASKAKELADLALATTQKRFPGSKLHNDQADAWRHCFWSAMMAKDPALQPAYVSQTYEGSLAVSYTYTDFAYKVGYNHEFFGNKAGQPLIEYAMDMHNNNIGLAIGRKLGEKASTDDVIAACDKALKDGELIWIVDGKLTKPAVYNEPTKSEFKIKSFSSYSRPCYKKVTTDQSGKVVETGEPFSPHDISPFK